MRKNTLERGMNAPDLVGNDGAGKPVSIADFRGRKLILFFYPKDNTPGCTAVACSLRDDMDALRQAGYELLGVSPDSVRKHQNFSLKYDLPFRLLSDVDKKNAMSYGVWGMKKFMGRELMGILRTTFLIDENGRIEHVIRKVRTKDHARQILELLAN